MSVAELTPAEAVDSRDCAAWGCAKEATRGPFCDEHQGLGTFSEKVNRVYVRKFDHDEARRRHADGEAITALAREYEVSYTAVERIVDPEFGARFDARAAAWQMSGVCRTCGKEGVSRRFGRCKDCANREISTSVRPDELRCSSCNRWLPDSAFPRSRIEKTRRGRHAQCTSCQTEARRHYRDRKKVPCPGCGRPTSPPGDRTSRRRFSQNDLCLDCTLSAQRKENSMPPEPTFVIFREESPGLWREEARVLAKDRREALTQAFNGKLPEGRVAVVSTQAFKPGKVVPVQVYDIELE